MRLGLSAKFWLIVLTAALLSLVLGFIGWQQQVSGVKQLTHLSGEAIHEASLRSEQRRALAMAQLVADALVNPLYYFDLSLIGETARSALAQPEVAYVLIHDADGRIVHDGSADISRFGQRMGDALAAEAITASEPRIQIAAGVIDAAVPIWLGQERIGGVRVGISLLAPAMLEREAGVAVQARGVQLQRRMLTIALLLSGVLLALVALTAWLISRGLVEPVQRLAHAAHQMAQGDYLVEWPLSSRSDEIGELEEAFMRMGESVGRHDRDIRRLAFDDSLTGLPNRIAFRETLNTRVQVAERHGGELALLFVDLDDFKRINDTLGHDAGDEVLKLFSVRVRQAVDKLGHGRAEVARFGGDEFVALLSGTDVRDRAARLAQAFLAELRQPIEVGGQSIVLAASVGITLYPQDAVQATALLKNADIAMYRAKLDGKNCFRFYTRDMDIAVERQMQMEQDLRLALENNELSVLYQPIYSNTMGRIVGAEALVRWKHPQRGQVPPDQFIAVAEQTGQIDAIGRFVLRTACQDATAWPLHGGEALFVSVNVSARQLHRGDLPDIVEYELRRWQLAPHRLHLELTETAMFSHEGEAIAAATRLRATGTKIWLDDFGTGFSGLSHLRRVPADGVKIDRSFVADMLDDPDDLALTAAIIAMAHSLGIVVTAEGVETEGQYEALRQRGCDNVQGYWLGRPMSSSDLVMLLEESELRRS